MPVAGITISEGIPELRALQASLRKLGDNKALSAILSEALEKAIFPAYLRLKEVSPVGPTGNLKRAADYKVKPYPNNGRAVALIGYRQVGKADSVSAAGGSVQVGPDRAFHQWWVEFGTRDRTVPGRRSRNPQPVARNYERRSPTVPFTRVRLGRPEIVQGSGVLQKIQEQTPTYIASSFNRLGGLRKVFRQNGRMVTDPTYPNAFFKKSKTPIVIRPFPVGGWAGRPPVQTAWQQSESKVVGILASELQLSLERAVGAVAAGTGKGTIDGTNTLAPA